MTLTDLKTLQSAGWDIGNHTSNHINLVEASGVNMIASINNGYDWLVANGFGNTAKYFCYPFTSYNDAVIAEVKKKHILATGGSMNGHFNINDVWDSLNLRYLINAYPTTVLTAETAIDNAITLGIPLVLIFHNIVDSDATGENYLTENFYLISDYLKTKQDAGLLDVITFSDYYNALRPYAVGTNNIDIGAGATIYADGRFENTGTASGNTASLSITPIGGFGTSDWFQYMDISIDTWDTTGNKNKQWTATSTSGDFLTHATSTINTIGDLGPNTYYQFKLDGTASTTAIVNNSQCTNGVCLSDSSGNLTFTYQGGYSTHTFALEKDVTGPSAFTLSSPNNNSSVSTRPNLSWNATSDSESGLAKYQLYINNTLNRDNISSSAVSITPASDLTCGGYTWFIRAIDNAGNITDSNTYNMALLCGGGLPVRSPSTPTAYQTYDPTTGETTTGKAPAQSAPVATSPTTPVNSNTTIDLISNIIQEAKDIIADKINSLSNFISKGTASTLVLGEGERKGVIESFKSAFGKTPSTETDWEDVIKIANGRWPGQIKAETEKNAETVFKKIYLRNPDRTNARDDAAITVIAYGLRPANRNLESEKKAIGFFKNIYSYSPKTATAWDVVRAIAYSGSTR
jgi:hypothetical protein